MSSSSKQKKLTSFFAQNKAKSEPKEDKQEIKLSKNERLRQILNDMKSKQETKNPGTNDANPSIPYYAPILDQIAEQRQFERERLIKSNKKYNQQQLGIDILNGCKQNYFHGPTYGDHTDSKASWKGYYEHRNKKMRQQFKNSDRSIYGDLSSNGIHFNKESFHKSKHMKKKRERQEFDDEHMKHTLHKPKKRKLNTMEHDEQSIDDKKDVNGEDIEEEELSGIFSGITVYFNGRTNDLSSFHLNKVILMNGGNFSVNPNSKVTHIITTNLSRSKINRAMDKMGKFKCHQVYYVTSDWITDSVKNGKLMKEEEYLVFKTKKHGNDIKGYFGKK